MVPQFGLQALLCNKHQYEWAIMPVCGTVYGQPYQLGGTLNSISNHSNQVYSSSELNPKLSQR